MASGGGEEGKREVECCHTGPRYAACVSCKLPADQLWGVYVTCTCNSSHCRILFERILCQLDCLAKAIARCLGVENRSMTSKQRWSQDMRRSLLHKRQALRYIMYSELCCCQTVSSPAEEKVDSPVPGKKSKNKKKSKKDKQDGTAVVSDGPVATRQAAAQVWVSKTAHSPKPHWG